MLSGQALGRASFRRAFSLLEPAKGTAQSARKPAAAPTPFARPDWFHHGARRPDIVFQRQPGAFHLRARKRRPIVSGGAAARALRRIGGGLLTLFNAGRGKRTLFDPTNLLAPKIHDLHPAWLPRHDAQFSPFRQAKQHSRFI
jgi:hypothetical protein